eukprot:s7454_g2.t3
MNFTEHQVGCLIMDGAGGKAFCAGGDVQMIREEGLAGGSLPADFFFEVRDRFPAGDSPWTGCVQVSLFDGITMGGGVGLSTHGPFRIVTEKTRFAMPEMAIGLFPDVGATQILSRLKAGPAVGLFLGITGTNISAWDCLEAGVATHYVPSARLPELREKLLSRFRAGLVGAAAMKLCEEIIAETSSGSSARSENPVLSAENLSVINRCFNAPTVEEIVVRLRAETCGFAAETLQKMFRSCSPTSCKVTLQAMQDLQRTPRSIGEVLQQKEAVLVLVQTCPTVILESVEGIRAVLVDKDRKQKWTPSWDSLDEVTEAKVSEFFSPLDAGHSRGELHLEDIFAFSESRRSAFPEVHLKSKL